MPVQRMGSPSWACSNRTFMELKSRITYQSSCLVNVLIVPLWNWNPRAAHHRGRLECSNRTFMELKLPTDLYSSLTTTVLIVPLWNWNEIPKGEILQALGVLIVPLWNWNDGGIVGSRVRNCCSNRTFMELKLGTWQGWNCVATF